MSIHYIKLNQLLLSLFLKLNNYGYSDQSIDEVKEHIIDRKMPEKIDSNAKAERYHDKWSQFEIRNDNLFHKKHNLEVVPNEKRNEKIKELYEDQSIGPGRGIEMFYHTVCQKYLNFWRSDVSDFLKK